MIVVRVDGGLGNQMFQVAFGMQLAQRHQSELVLDLEAYRQGPEHGFLLDRFAVETRSLRPDERWRVPARYRAAGSGGWRGRLSVWGGLKRWRQRPYGFAEKYLRAPDDSYLVGYWQSERFFPDVRSEVRRQFRPNVSLSPATERLRERMLDGPSVALHIRRGDYITNPQAAQIYRQLSIDYYQRSALAWLAEKERAEVVVFSNDIAWCRAQLALPCPVHFVEHTTAGTAHEDLWLMTAAQCQIIANSTFSWWGAWLGERPEQRVYAPRHFFHPGTLDDADLPCEGWVLVDDPNPQRKAA
jgi:hypothetical protein